LFTVGKSFAYYQFARWHFAAIGASRRPTAKLYAALLRGRQVGVVNDCRKEMGWPSGFIS
jgi:hypothetical protein